MKIMNNVKPIISDFYTASIIYRSWFSPFVFLGYSVTWLFLTFLSCFCDVLMRGIRFLVYKHNKKQ